MFVLDTNVVSELRKLRSGRTDPNFTCWASQLSRRTLFISVITIMEVEQGILSLQRRDAPQAMVLRAWLDTNVLTTFDGRILMVDVAVAKQCARLHVPNTRTERDAFIAATALVHGMTVVTRNVADFETTGVAILNPWQR